LRCKVNQFYRKKKENCKKLAQLSNFCAFVSIIKYLFANDYPDCFGYRLAMTSYRFTRAVVIATAGNEAGSNP
jgi:hypothetical protein